MRFLALASVTTAIFDAPRYGCSNLSER